MKTREEAIAYGLSFPDTYRDAPFILTTHERVEKSACHALLQSL